MLKRSHHESKRKRKTKEEAHQKERGDDGRACSRGRENWQCSSNLPAGGSLPPAIFQMEEQIQGGWYPGAEVDETRSKEEGSGKRTAGGRGGPSTDSSVRVEHRATVTEKKRALGLHGPLTGRHLPKDTRESLVEIIDEGRASGLSVATVSQVLELNPRAYYRWKSTPANSHHGGGGGHNKVTPKEEVAVVRLAKKKPDWACRRIAYHLERKGKAFIGKTKVAEIMKEHGLNHPFEKRPPKEVTPPADMLLYEPWKKNLIWGMDWTWVRVDGSFMFLLVLIDWYSRKILSWGLFNTITKFQVVAVVTESVAIENIDMLPEGSLKPRVVADHGSANACKYTKDNIEVQGLDLWLSGIGRPTGNARTERVIGTLKAEEIKLQDEYESEAEARRRIDRTIQDYNFNRPNSGNGGFAPNSVHHIGRFELMKRRERGRQSAYDRRRKHWESEIRQ